MRPDSFLAALSVMLVLTVLQRAIGLVRGIWFCHALDDAALGQWAMGFGFLSLVTPMFLFGIPGSLPRFVEPHLQQGSLRTFLRQIFAATGILALTCTSGLLLFPNRISAFVFGGIQSQPLVLCLALALACTVLMLVTDELLRGLRLIRLSSVVVCCQSLGFSLLGIACLELGGGVPSLLVAFAAASLFAVLLGWWGLLRANRSIPADHHSLAALALWRRILPYALSIWWMNVLSNSFELTDRYMLLHLTPTGDEMGQRAVGQYHSGAIIPTVLISLSTMVGGILMPYLAADWERDQRGEVFSRLRLAIASVAVAFTAIAAASILFAPLLYNFILAGRYEGARQILPLCLIYAIWTSLAFIAQQHLFLIEKGRYAAYVLAVGLGINLALNAWWVPLWGLHGAVAATCISQLIVLCGILLAMHRTGFPFDLTVLWAILLPATLLAGWEFALLCVILALFSNRQVRHALSRLWSMAGCQFAPLAK